MAPEMPIIGPAGPVSRLSGSAAAGRRAGAAFHLPAESTASAAPAAPAAEVSLSTLLALQDEAEPVEDREARRHAKDLLAELAAIHRALLGRPGAEDSLARLGALCAAMPEMAREPRLAEAVAAIRLRARVELARYTAAAPADTPR